jgi:nucleolar complex protein 2
MKPLIFPLVQVMTGVLKLSSSRQFEPLRFHIIKSMVKLSQTTDVFIPTIPFVVNILERLSYPTNIKKKKKEVQKHVDFNCLLRVKETEESWFTTAIVRNAYEVLLDYFAGQSHRIGFPELAFPPVSRIKKFLKQQCKDPEDHRLLKQVIDKIEENSKFITEKRTSVTFGFSDSGAVEIWENERLSEGTPLNTFLNKYKTLRKETEKREMQQIKADIEEKKKRKQHKRGQDDEDEKDQSEAKESTSLPKKSPLVQKKKKKKSVKKLKPMKKDPLQDIELKGIEMSDDDD